VGAGRCISSFFIAAMQFRSSDFRFSRSVECVRCVGEGEQISKRQLPSQAIQEVTSSQGVE
jgi:hypothetical protein